MPKVAQTFKQRAIEFALMATPEETEEIVAIMKQISKTRGGSDNGNAKPARKRRAPSTQTITAQDHIRDDATG